MIRITTSFLATVLLGSAASTSAFANAETSRAAILQVLEKGCAAFAAGDMEGAMTPYSKDLFLYDLAPPSESNYDLLKKVNSALREAMSEPPACTYEKMVITVVSKDFAFAHYVLPYSAHLKNGQFLSIRGRVTDIFRKFGSNWKIVHEHFSVPVDPFTGKGDLTPP